VINRAINAALGLVPGWVWAATVAALLATNCATGYQRDSARQQLDGLRLQVAEAEQQRSETARLAEAGYRARERTHAASIQATTQKAAHEKRLLAADLQRTLASLHNRPERPAAAGGAVPESAAGAVACTGASLFAPDARFLVGRAAQADELRAELRECQAAYDAAVTLTSN